VIQCPGCGQVDQVARVQAVYENGLTVTKTVGRTSVRLDGLHGPYSSSGTVRGSSTAQTALSRSLMPPRRPWAARGWGHAITAAFGVMCVVNVVVNAAVGAAASWAGLIAAAWFLVAFNKRHRVAEPQWRRRWSTWRLLFCCCRCDGIFLPSGASPEHLCGQLVERHAMNAFLARCALSK
jgi:hypothetical protein